QPLRSGVRRLGHRHRSRPQARRHCPGTGAGRHCPRNRARAAERHRAVDVLRLRRAQRRPRSETAEPLMRGRGAEPTHPCDLDIEISTLQRRRVMTDRETRLNELAEKYLPTEMCDRFRTRADVYDRENRFFDEDLEELKALGYLTLFVPESHGGPGLSLFEVSRLQQRLASAAPATA